MRLDQYLVDQHKIPSRARAQNLIASGEVSVNGTIARKASQKVGKNDDIIVSAVHQYVSRGALKLVHGLKAFEIDPAGKVCLDLGASTGGFCEVLLERGAAKIYAVDVGHGQLHPSIIKDQRVINLEKTHAKDLNADIIPEPIELLVCDVSFISLTKALPLALDLCGAGAMLCVLVKPQFEVGRENIGKGGLVKLEPNDIKQFLAEHVLPLFVAHGWQESDLIDSPIKGGDGNREYLISARKI